MPTKLDLKTLPKGMKENPIFKDLPKELKDPAKFDKIELELFKIVQSDHKHKSVKEYVLCAWCNKKRELRQNRIKTLGFKSPGQYQEWKKIMTIIKNKASFQIR